MTDTSTVTERIAQDTIAAASDMAAASRDRMKAAEAENDALAADADARARLREQADKRQLRAALRDLTEGVRGMVRVAPLTAVVVGVAAGMLLRGRKRRPPPLRR
jgi:hypothetical protein